MPQVFGISLPRRVVNAAVTPLACAGIAPLEIHLLTVCGRRTGRRYTTPVIVLRHAGERWLVAPYGERSWVKNARAAGSVELRRGRRRETVGVEELPAGERGPVHRAYLQRNPSTRDAFAADAGGQPVFRLVSRP